MVGWKSYMSGKGKKLLQDGKENGAAKDGNFDK